MALGHNPAETQRCFSISEGTDLSEKVNMEPLEQLRFFDQVLHCQGVLRQLKTSLYRDARKNGGRNSHRIREDAEKAFKFYKNLTGRKN